MLSFNMMNSSISNNATNPTTSTSQMIKSNPVSQTITIGLVTTPTSLSPPPAPPSTPNLYHLNPLMQLINSTNIPSHMVSSSDLYVYPSTNIYATTQTSSQSPSSPTSPSSGSSSSSTSPSSPPLIVLISEKQFQQQQQQQKQQKLACLSNGSSSSSCGDRFIHSMSTQSTQSTPPTPPPTPTTTPSSNIIRLNLSPNHYQHAHTHIQSISEANQVNMAYSPSSSSNFLPYRIHIPTVSSSSAYNESSTSNHLTSSTSSPLVHLLSPVSSPPSILYTQLVSGFLLVILFEFFSRILLIFWQKYGFLPKGWDGIF